MQRNDLTALRERLEAMANKVNRHQRGTLAVMSASHMKELVADESDLRAAARCVGDTQRYQWISVAVSRVIETWKNTWGKKS